MIADGAPGNVTLPFLRKCSSKIPEALHSSTMELARASSQVAARRICLPLSSRSHSPSPCPVRPTASTDLSVCCATARTTSPRASSVSSMSCSEHSGRGLYSFTRRPSTASTSPLFENAAAFTTEVPRSIPRIIRSSSPPCGRRSPLEHPAPVLLVGARVEAVCLLLGQVYGLSGGENAGHDAGVLGGHRRHLVYTTRRHAQGHEAVVLQVYGLGSGAHAALVLAQAVAQGVGQGKPHVSVRHVQGEATQNHDLVWEDRAPRERQRAVGTKDGVDGRRMRVPHEHRLSLGETQRMHDGLDGGPQVSGVPAPGREERGA